MINPAEVRFFWEGNGHGRGDDLAGDVAGDGCIGRRDQGTRRKGNRGDQLAAGRHNAAHLHQVRVADPGTEEGSVKGIERREPLRRSGGQKIMGWGFDDHSIERKLFSNM